jgi:hypothetical protein
MSYRLTFFKGFDQATQSLSDSQINQIFDALTELAQEDQIKGGNIKIARDLWVNVEVEGDTLHVVDISQRPSRA